MGDRGTPHRCPICNGQGWTWTAFQLATETCRPCKGTGIVWSGDEDGDECLNCGEAVTVDSAHFDGREYLCERTGDSDDAS